MIRYLSLIFDRTPATRFAYATPLGVDPDDTNDDGSVRVSVDSATVAFVDAHAAKLFATRVETSGLELIDDIFDSDQPDSWFNLMDSPDHYREGCANITLPFLSDKENIVLSISGWGDGYYPVIAGYDAKGNLVSYHIDLEVVEAP